MAGSKMQMLERQMARREERIPVPDTSGGIGGVIEQLIADEVASRVGEAVKEKSNKHLDRLFKPEPRYTDFKQLPPTPRTPFPTAPMESQVFYDGAQKMSWVEITCGGKVTKIKVIRDGAGRMIGCKEITDSPVLPALDIDPKADARQYKPGESR